MVLIGQKAPESRSFHIFYGVTAWR